MALTVGSLEMKLAEGIGIVDDGTRDSAYRTDICLSELARRDLVVNGVRAAVDLDDGQLTSSPTPIVDPAHMQV